MSDLDLTHPLVTDEVSKFIDWLLDNHKVGNAASLAYFLEKPWKYQSEYNEFRAESKRESTRADDPRDRPGRLSH